MTWLPEWRVTVGDDVYTTVTAVSFSAGRVDIDKQCTAGYCQVDIINTDGSPFTVNVTDALTLELKDSAGNYVTMYGGEVSDFTIGVRSPEETGFITYGRILGVGYLAKLSKSVYNTALAEALDGAQIAAIVNDVLNLNWDEVTPSLTWNTYPAATTWEDAESYVGNIDSGFYTMINLAASATARSNSLTDQIANSALGQIHEEKNGLVSYDDADHRSNYLAANGYTNLDGAYSSPSTIRSITTTNRIRNSLIYKYGTGYASTYSASSSDSIATYGLYEKSFESNIKGLTDITEIGTRELNLRTTPKGSLEAITFRLDNPNLPSGLLDSLINIFFGQPVLIDNLPSNFLGGTFEGFVENIAVRANPSSVDLTLYITATEFSLSTTQWETVIPSTIDWDTTNATLIWNNATGALN